MRRIGVIVAIVAIVVCAGLAWWEFRNRFEAPPVFERRDGRANLAEMIVEPPGYIYGSSINVFYYTDEQGQIEEIVVAGHADSDTCRRASALIENALLEKPSRADDFLVAGAGRLVRQEDYSQLERMKSVEGVRRYKALRNDQRTLQLLLGIQNADLSGGQTPEQLRTRLEGINKEIATLEKTPDVKAYIDNTRGGEILTGLVRDLRELADETGLARLHKLPVSLLAAVNARINKAVADDKPEVMTFGDLLPSIGDDSDATVMVPMMMIRSGAPVSLALDDAHLTSAAYEEAAKVNRSEVEYAMVGDASNRLKRLTQKLDQLNETAKECSTLSAADLATTVVLNQTCTVDGCFPSEKPVKITRDAYCKQIVPDNQAAWQEWIDNTKRLLERIENDKASGKDGRIDAMGLATLIDSMLRDWDLPVGRSQAAFEAWRTLERGAAWRDLLSKLSGIHVASSAMSGEYLLFNVKRGDTGVQVRPIHVLNVRTGALVIDPRIGATQVVDTWGNRKQSPATQISRSPGDILDDVVKGKPIEDGKTALLLALSANPGKAGKDLLDSFGKTFPSRADALESARSKTQPRLEFLEFSEAWATVNHPQPTEEKDEQKALRQYLGRIEDRERILQRFPSAPPELELATAREAALVVARSRGSSPSNDDPIEKTAWRLMAAFGGRAPTDVTTLGRELAPRQQLDKVLSISLAKFDFDAKGIIERCVRRAEKTEPAYVARAFAETDLPKDGSQRLRTLEAMQDAGLTMTEDEALHVAQMEKLLHAKTLLQGASDALLRTKPDLSRSAQLLDQASSGFSAAAFGPIYQAEMRLSNLRRTADSGSLLSRLEVDGLIDSEERLVRQQIDAVGVRRLAALASDMSTRKVVARTDYESGNYANGLSQLLDSPVPLVLVHPALKLRVKTPDALGTVDKMAADLAENGIINVWYMSAGQRTDLAALEGLPQDLAVNIAQQLRAVPSDWWSSVYPLIEQLQRVPITLDPKSHPLLGLLSDARVRLAVLKATVYGCAVPLSATIPLTGRCNALPGEQRRSDRLDTGTESGVISVPTLDELVKNARQQIASR
jgi:hypothetical protein